MPGGVAPQPPACPCSNLHKPENNWRFLRAGRTVTVMVTILSAIVSIFEFRVRSRASLELELIALRHQVTVLRRQRPGRPRLSCLDRIWPQVIDAIAMQCGNNLYDDAEPDDPNHSDASHQRTITQKGSS